ncbi:MAG: hypothetical protein HYY06_20390 [Deltaproteobacteria bacterium]|nr:hypothetical protein [Deltaproteobacteria bacterium]
MNRVGVALSCLLAISCGAPKGPGGAPADSGLPDCVDADGDGRGDLCAEADCDDGDPEVWADADCLARCAGDPQATGCPCDPDANAEPIACYRGAAGTESVGDCRAGRRTCGEEGWSACEGEVVPAEEICDGTDDDCDGEVDEGVKNACGGCGPCERGCAGPADGCEDWSDDEMTAGIGETDEGWLVLDNQSVDRHVIWPSSAGTGQVYRVDSSTLAIEAAFWSGPGGSNESPSRSGVDDSGNLVIANRTFVGDTLGSITKIAADPGACPDRDGDGLVETSSRWDDKLAFRTHEDWDDDCILWHTVVGGPNAVPRAVALHTEMDLDGVAHEVGWVGLYGESKFVQFDATSGELTGIEAPTPGFNPYGGAVDRGGWIWVTGLTAGSVGRFDTANPAASFETLALPAGAAAYRVIVDENDVPWVAGSNAFRLDRDTGTWQSAGLPESPGNIASDGVGTVWAASYTYSQRVYRIANDDAMAFHSIETPGTATFGMAVDFDGHAWTFGYNDGTASVIDLVTEEVTHIFNDCAGGPCLSYPYVRGDITGLQRRNAVSPRGGWSRLYEGCGAETDWKAIVIDADAPPGTNVRVSARTSAVLLDLQAGDWVTVASIPPDGPEIDLDAAFAAAGVADGTFLEIEVVLESQDHETSPTVRGIDVRWLCPEDLQ